ncbi:hypothetical protein PFISCL1PPCAC_11029 [Pristionchus fissidentatus]|uniref:BTB domain-containing protein n=1 Tax=Pristionchus fissidentatus TaxID=1538716 RepID=A0AAV5VJ13_9BILA|nr:hypothetical protein PFISCL1PPCAC_11029 [Pristionchus fissidentatus]
MDDRTRGAFEDFDHSSFPDTVFLRMRKRSFVLSGSYLALQSPFFHNLFYGASKEESRSYQLDVDPATFEDLIDTIYPCYKRSNCCSDCSSSFSDRLILALQLKMRCAVKRLLREKTNPDEAFVILRECNAWDQYKDVFDAEDERRGEEIAKAVRVKRDYSDSMHPLTVTDDFPDLTRVNIGVASFVVSASMLSLHSSILRSLLFVDDNLIQGVSLNIDPSSFITFVKVTSGSLPDFSTVFLDDLVSMGATNLRKYCISLLKSTVKRSIDRVSSIISLIRHHHNQGELNIHKFFELARGAPFNAILNECSFIPSDLLSSIRSKISECSIPLRIEVCDQSNCSLHLILKRGGLEQADQIKAAIQSHLGIDRDLIRILINGNRVADGVCLVDQGIESGSVIEIYQEQGGCYRL